MHLITQKIAVTAGARQASACTAYERVKGDSIMAGGGVHKMTGEPLTRTPSGRPHSCGGSGVINGKRQRAAFSRLSGRPRFFPQGARAASRQKIPSHSLGRNGTDALGERSFAPRGQG